MKARWEMKNTTGTIKVQNGTPVGSESMCATCRKARIIKGFSESEEIIFCSWHPSRPVPFRVRQCSEYDDKRLPRRWDMEQIAYILVPKSAGRTVGFLTPEQYRERQEDEDE
jgi:hypothetical protein